MSPNNRGSKLAAADLLGPEAVQSDTQFDASADPVRIVFFCRSIVDSARLTTCPPESTTDVK